MKLLLLILLSGCASAPYNPHYNPPETRQRACPKGTMQVCNVRGSDRFCHCSIRRFL